MIEYDDREPAPVCPNCGAEHNATNPTTFCDGCYPLSDEALCEHLNPSAFEVGGEGSSFFDRMALALDQLKARKVES